MDENKFDERVFRILEHAQPDGLGYVPDDKALELMEEGYLKKSPKSEWHISGHKSTKKGTALYDRWTKWIREQHGHIWMTNADSEGKEAKTDYDKELDSFAYTAGEYHNGYKCKQCGFGFCHHCHNEWEIPKCSENTKDVDMSSDSKLDDGMVAFDRSVRASVGLK